MTSFVINKKSDDLIEVQFDKLASGDQVVRDAKARLDEMINGGELAGGKLLKIYGPMSIPVTYVMAHYVAHLYGAIALSDTRLGAYVVVSSTTPDYPFASRISFETGEVTEIPPDRSNSPAISINYEQGILRTKINGNVQKDGEQLVLETEARLEELINTKQLQGGKNPLLINGRFSILASFVIARKLAHLYSAIAVYDPKIAEENLDKYIVVITHEEYEMGDIINLETSQQHNIKVALCGEANTGKTCFREGIKKALSKLCEDSYIVSGCPDGDGAWHSETAQNHPELAKELKKAYKAKFTPEFAHLKAQQIRNIPNEILVFDVGGKISDENELIMSEATHAVILAKSEAGLEEWKQFCDRLNLPIAAIIYSNYEAEEDRIKTDSPCLQGTVHYLERGEDVANRPMVKKLAQSLVNLVSD